MNPGRELPKAYILMIFLKNFTLIRTINHKGPHISHRQMRDLTRQKILPSLVIRNVQNLARLYELPTMMQYLAGI